MITLFENFTSTAAENFIVNAFQSLLIAFQNAKGQNIRILSYVCNRLFIQKSLQKLPKEILNILVKSLADKTIDKYRLETTHLMVDLLPILPHDEIEHTPILQVLQNTFSSLAFEKSHIQLLKLYTEVQPNIGDFPLNGDNDQIGLDTLFLLMLSERSDIRSETRRCFTAIAEGDPIDAVVKAYGKNKLAALGKSILPKVAKEGIDEEGFNILHNFAKILQDEQNPETIDFKAVYLKFVISVAGDKSNAFQQKAGEILELLLKN